MNINGNSYQRASIELVRVAKTKYAVTKLQQKLSNNTADTVTGILSMGINRLTTV